MSTEKTIIYKKNFTFVLYGGKDQETEVYQFFNSMSNRDQKKVIAVLDSINTKPMMYCHDQKFKRWEGKIWEIKAFKVRIACYWQIKGRLLVGIYGLYKKKNDWPSSDAEKARRLYSMCSVIDFQKEVE